MQDDNFLRTTVLINRGLVVLHHGPWAPARSFKRGRAQTELSRELGSAWGLGRGPTTHLKIRRFLGSCDVHQQVFDRDT